MPYWAENWKGEDGTGKTEAKYLWVEIVEFANRKLLIHKQMENKLNRKYISVEIAVIIVANAHFTAWVNLATGVWNFKRYNSNKY